jgi:hypothetical protein
MMLQQDGMKDIGRALLTRVWLCVLCCWPLGCLAQQDYYKKPDNRKIPAVTSSYDYAPMAAEITAGCASDYEKVRAI